MSGAHSLEEHLMQKMEFLGICRKAAKAQEDNFSLV
jgi:hypothetical protein